MSPCGHVVSSINTRGRLFIRHTRHGPRGKFFKRWQPGGKIIVVNFRNSRRLPSYRWYRIEFYIEMGVLIKINNNLSVVFTCQSQNQLYLV